METVSAEKEILQLVSFKLDGVEYALDILRVHEVNRMTDITVVPDAGPFVDGVINLRGRVIPVVNLRGKLGLEPRAGDCGSPIMIVDAGSTVGLVVDSVSEVLRLSSDNVEPPPPMVVSSGGDSVLGIGRLDDRLVMLLDIRRLLAGGSDSSGLAVRGPSEPRDRNPETAAAA